MADLNETEKEFTPEETPPPIETPLPIVEEPEVEVPVPEEGVPGVEKVVEGVLEEPETTPVEPPTDYKTLYENERLEKENEQQRYNNLMQLAGRWGQELGITRDKAKVFEPSPSAMTPEQAREEFDRDPTGFIQKQAASIAAQQAQQVLTPKVEAINFLIAHPQWIEAGRFKPEIDAVVKEIEVERPWLADGSPVPNRFEIYDALITSKLLQKKINTEMAKSKQSLSDQQQRTLLAKKNAKLAPVTGAKQETFKKPLADMSVEELEKVLPKSDRPLGWAIK